MVIGGGVFFALFTSFLVWVDEKFGGTGSCSWFNNLLLVGSLTVADIQGKLFELELLQLSGPMLSFPAVYSNSHFNTCGRTIRTGEYCERLTFAVASIMFTKSTM